MQGSLQYIDSQTDAAIVEQIGSKVLPEGHMTMAKEKAMKVVAGFQIHDEAAERKHLDDMIEARTRGLASYRAVRSALRDRLMDIGVTPLAIVPKQVWYKMCREAGLFVLSPDSKGKVAIGYGVFASTDRRWVDLYSRAADGPVIDSQSWVGVLRGAVAAEPEKPRPTGSQRGLLNIYFPDGKSGETSDQHGVKATLLLPKPPQDVVDILLKVSNAKNFGDLKVAAVPEAIGFAETPRQLLEAWKGSQPVPFWQEAGFSSLAEWAEKDPIIFMETSACVAVVAQFGDFPVEMEVVDKVIAEGNLISDSPSINDMAITMKWSDDIRISEIATTVGSQRRQVFEGGVGYFGGTSST